jgi:hypothetical protein
MDAIVGRVPEVELHDGRLILLTTFRKQRNKERTEITRARKAAEDCATRNP